MTSKIFLTCLIFLFLLGCKKRSTDDYQYYKPYQKTTVKTVAPDTLKSARDTTKVSVVAKPSVSQANTKVVDLNDSYFIVVASYVVKDYAIAQKQTLTNLGFKPEILMVNDDGWYKLAVQSDKSLAEAEAGLKALIESKSIPSDSYIVFRRNKP